MDLHIGKPVQDRGAGGGTQALRAPARSDRGQIQADSDAVDPVAVDALRRLVGEESQGVLSELIGDYLAHTSERLAELQAALAIGDAVAACRLAHTIKGSSASFGASALAQLCAEIETGGSSPAPADAVRARLVQEFAAVQAALQP